LSALKNVSDNGMIVIDDVDPGDYAGSLKTWREMSEYRKTQGHSGSMVWWGDVCKLIPFIHDFLPALDYRSTTQVKKQTIVVLSNLAPS